MIRKRIAVVLGCASVGLATSGCPTGPRDCFGLRAARNFSVRLVDDASDPMFYADPGARLESATHAFRVPSCGAFDGVTTGSVVDLTSAQLISWNGTNCSVVRADATLEDGRFLESIRDNGFFGELVFSGGGGGFTVIHRGVVEGCSGSWVLDFDLTELATWNGVQIDKAWSSSQLFDAGVQGGQAPILAARMFVLDEGASCPALGAMTSCVDIFLARFEPTTP